MAATASTISARLIVKSSFFLPTVFRISHSWYLNILPMMAAIKSTPANPISSGQTDGSGVGGADGGGAAVEVGTGV
jgi:hypothetical protein